MNKYKTYLYLTPFHPVSFFIEHLNYFLSLTILNYFPHLEAAT